MLCSKAFRPLRRRKSAEEALVHAAAAAAATTTLHCRAHCQHSHYLPGLWWRENPRRCLTPQASSTPLSFFYPTLYQHHRHRHHQNFHQSLVNCWSYRAHAHDVAAADAGNEQYHACIPAHDVVNEQYHVSNGSCTPAHSVVAADLGDKHFVAAVDVDGEHYHGNDDKLMYASEARCHAVLHQPPSLRPLCWQQNSLEGKQGYSPGEASLRLLCEDVQLDKALAILYRMRSPPATGTYLSLLKACIKKRSLFHTKQVHAHLVQHHVQLSGILGDYLTVTLAKCGAVDIARQVSSALPRLTVFSWTAMISAYVECGHMHEALKLHQRMEEDGVEPNTFTYVSLFKACSTLQDLELGKRLHADARRKGFVSDVYVGSTLVSMYGKCRAVVDAEELFVALSDHSIVSWNAMLSAYVNGNQGQKTLQLYRQMHHEDVISDQHTFVYALQACGILLEKESAVALDELSRRRMALEIGEALHADARRKGFASDVFVVTALLSVYAKCGAILRATDVFNSLTHRDTISWNAMLSANIQLCKAEKALQLYKQMQQEGMSPDQLSCVLSFQACGALAEKEETSLLNGQSVKGVSLEIGQAIQGDAYKKGFVSDLIICNTLVSMYGKCGAVLEAEDVFNAMVHRDVVSWTAMLSAYLEHDQADRAFWLYKEMQNACLDLDDITLVCMLQVCSESGNLEICNQLHFDITSVEYDQMSFIAATLIYTYGNCASMLDAQAVFDECSKADVVPWNTCIAGYATEGEYVASLRLFEKLSLEGIEPDELTCSSVLASCRHTGLVEAGLGYFEIIKTYYGITPNLKHYASVFDLLSRAGDLRRVQNMLERMPMQADLTIWLCVLGACSAHGNLDLAKQAFTHAVNLQPTLAIPYILMANTFANAGLQECAAEVEKTRKQQGACSFWMEQEESASLPNLWE